MNTRKIMTYAHLILAALFMPMLLNMPITGSLYILGYKGSEVKTEAFTVANTLPADTEQHEQYFRDQFKQEGIDYDFEYIRSTATDFIFRPTTQTYYVASNKDGNLVFTHVEPSFLKRLIELHKGHGPVAMRWFSVAFGMALILTTLSGVWLAWTVKPYRKATLISFGVGVLAIVACII